MLQLMELEKEMEDENSNEMCTDRTLWDILCEMCTDRTLWDILCEMCTDRTLWDILCEMSAPH